MQFGRFTLKLLLFFFVSMYSVVGMAQIQVNISKNMDAAEAGPDGSLTISIDLNGEPNLQGDVFVCFDALGGTATEGEDFAQMDCEGAGFADFDQNGPLSQTFPLGVINDTDPEGLETVEIGITFAGYNCDCSSPTIGPNITMDIIDDDNIGTVTVDRYFDDDNPAPVGIQLTCSDATPLVSTQTATEFSPAVFNLTEVGPNNTCEAVQSSGPGGYYADDYECSSLFVPPGGSSSCSIYNYFEEVQASVQFVGDAAEPNQDGAFRIILSGSPPYGGMEIFYQVGGSATEGEDYEDLGEIFMPYGSTSQQVTIEVIDDDDLEDTETVDFMLLNPSSNGDGNPSASGGTGGGEGGPFESYYVEGNGEVTIDIEDNDDMATFTVMKWFEDGNPASVQVTISCTDANVSSSTLSASQSSPAVFELTNVGSANTCSVTESVPSGYTVDYYNCSSVPLPGGSDDYCYVDNYYIPVVAQIQQQSNAAEPGQNGSFLVTLSGSAPFGGMEVNYTVGGTATAGEDYEALSSSIFMAFGTTSESIPVDVIDDNLFEDTETVILTLQGPDDGNCEVPSAEARRSGGGKSGTEEVCDGYDIGSSSQATVDIADDDRPEVTIEGVEDASEPNTDGSFRVFLARPAPVGGVTVGMVPDGSADAGVDYNSLPGEVFFAEGETSLTLVVSPIDDEEVEGTEEVKVFIRPSDDYTIARGSSPASINILDDDVEAGDLTLSVAATSSTAEPSGTGVFTVSLSEVAESDTPVMFTLGGTATPGVDYVEPSSPVVVPAGALSAMINIEVIDDETVEDTETVTVEISSSTGIPIMGDPTASIDIEDDDEPMGLTVSIAATSSTAEPSGTGVFTVSLSQASESDTTVSFTLGGTASAGADYVEPSSPVVVPAGSLSAPINIEVIDDELVEETETVSVTIMTDGTVPVAGNATATINIEDDDQEAIPAGIRVDPTSGLMTTEDGGTAQFSVVLETEPTATVSIAMASTDTTEGTISPESLEFNSSNWNMARTVTVTGVADTEEDGDIAYTVELSPAVSSDSSYSNLDPADVSVVNKDTTVIEPEGGAEFTSMTYTVKEVDGNASIGVRRTGSTTSALTVTFSTDDENPSNTAVAGEDYTSTSTEVSWAAGEDIEKFVNVPVFENTDKDDSATESVALSLSGASIETDSATLEIISEPSGPPIEVADLPPNQQQVAKVINESCPQFNNEPDFQALCTAMVVTDSELDSPLRETTADDAAVVRSSGMQTANIQVTAVDGRIGTLRGGGGAGFSASGFSVGLGEMSLNGGLMRSFIGAFDQNNPGFMQANANGNDDDTFIDEFGRWGAWISGRVIMGEKDLTTNQLDYDFDTAGLTFGMDYRFSDSLVGGIAVGYANTDSDLGSDDGKVKTKGYSVSLYGTWFKSDKFYLGASAGYGGNDYDHTRNVRYTIARPAPGNPVIDALPDWAFDVDQSFAADYDGRQYSAAISGGWDFNKNGWTFGPTFRVDWVSVDVDGYDERLTSSNSGGVAQFGWGVHIDDQKYTSLQPAIGFEFTKAVSASWGIFIPQGYIDVVSELDDDGILVTGRYLGDVNRVDFALQTDDFTETFVRAGLGFGLVLKNNKSAFFMVDGDLGRDLLKTYYINAGFRWQF